VRSDAVLPADPKKQLNAFQRVKLHPRGFWFVFWGELAERASFYGMRTVLALYLLTVLRYEKASGAQIMQGFMAACYVAPIFGGWLADRFLGRYKTILYFSVPYIAGHIILGGIQHRWAMFVALALLAFGSGSIKPNTSTLMGQMYEEQKKSFLLTEAFSYFYAAINIGAALSSLSLPLVRDKWGYGTALMIPAALMAVAFFFFAIGKRHYPVENVRARPPKTAEQKQLEWLTIRRIAGVFALIAVFWFVYDQQASTWIYFAKDHCIGHVVVTHVGDKIKKNVLLTVIPGVFSVTPDQIQGLNPVLIVILTPIFNFTWEAWKRRRGGVDVPDTRKMLLGFFIVIGCTAMVSVAGFLAGAGKVTVWFLLVATLIITLAELCISVVGLEFAYKRAAPGTKSVVTAAFLLTVFVGDGFFGVFYDKLYEKHLAPGAYFGIQTLIMVAAAVTFWWVARRFERGDEAALEPAPSPAES
jgi:proton-dependent oligopeptide transporter, POT family